MVEGRVVAVAGGEALDDEAGPGAGLAGGAVDRPVHRHRPGGGAVLEGGKDRAEAPPRRLRQQELVGVDEGDPVGLVPVAAEDLAIGGELRRRARNPGEGDVVDDPGAVEGGQEGGRSVVAAAPIMPVPIMPAPIMPAPIMPAVVGEEEAVDAEDAVTGDPFEDVGPLVLQDRPDGEAQAAGFQCTTPPG